MKNDNLIAMGYPPHLDPNEESDKHVLHFEDESLTRQEFKDDTNLDLLLKRHQMPALSRPPIFGEINFDTNLATVLDQVKTANALWRSLPKQLRDKYPNTRDLVAALYNGQLEKDITEALAPSTDDNAEPQTLPQELTWLRKRLTELGLSKSDKATAPPDTSPSAPAGT